MLYRVSAAAGILGGIFASNAVAQGGPVYAAEHKARACIAQAVDAVDVPGQIMVIDPADGGIKKYNAGPVHLAGVSGFYNFAPVAGAPAADRVSFIAKYYVEQAKGYQDAIAQIDVTFKVDADPGTQVTYARYIDDAGDLGAGEGLKITAGAADYMAASFGACMGFAPYLGQDGQPAKPAAFPALIR